MSPPTYRTPDEAARSYERRTAIQALVSLVVAAYIGTAIAGDRASTGVAAAIYVAVLAGSVVLHEIGHALAIRAIAGTLQEFRLGFGPVLLRRRIGPNTVFDLRPLVIAGHVGWLPPNPVRRRQLIVVSTAGPAVHAVLIVVALIGAHGAWEVWRIDLLVANVMALVSNLIPSTTGFTTTSAGHNDGAAIAGLIRGTRTSGRPAPLPLAATPEQHAASFAYAGHQALGRGERDLAESLLRQAMSLAPDEPITRALAAAIASTPPARTPGRN